jgi:hypothetical protein
MKINDESDDVIVEESESDNGQSRQLDDASHEAKKAIYERE